MPRQRIPNELHRLRGTYRKDRHGAAAGTVAPLVASCGECGAFGVPLFNVTFAGETFGPFCEAHAAEAAAILESS